MLTAKYKDSIISVDEHSASYLKEISDNHLLFCPDCSSPLLFKTYANKQSHFSHFSSDCSFPFREPESLEHESGKLCLYQWLQIQHTDISLERTIKETHQRSDIFIESLNTAIEFQCSPISSTTFSHRRALYQKAGIPDYWILGYSMHKQAHDTHSFSFRLNKLEQAVLSDYQILIYFDTLTKNFIFFKPEGLNANIAFGSHFIFSPAEVFFSNGKVISKFDFFLSSQIKRKEYLMSQSKRAKETVEFIRGVKITTPEPASKVLATKKQINYIKFLLHKNNKKIPYKLEGILLAEANHLIQRLERLQ